MQPTQDKDFDQLFKDAFADAEITPSKNLWNNIEQKIESKKTWKLPIYWLAAAVILIVATIGVLTYQQGNRIEPAPVAQRKSEGVKPVEKPVTIKEEKDIVPKIEKDVNQPLIATEVQKTKSVSPQVQPKIKSVEHENIVPAPEILKHEPIVAKIEKQEIVKEKIEEAIQPTEIAIAKTGTTIMPDEVVNENDQTENKGIRNMGDLVNLVVNKVDKRKDKFIQFRTDDDDSSIASINIGPFKIGKRKHK